MASFFYRFVKASGGILGDILSDFGRSFWLPFPTLQQKGAHHGFIAHGGEIKGAAPDEASKKAERIEEKTVKRTILSLFSGKYWVRCWRKG